MMRIVQFAIATLATILLLALFVARIAFEILGASTAPDDFALLKTRMPKLMGWLFTTPWWVPAIILIVASVATGWIFFRAIKGSALTPEIKWVSADEASAIAGGKAASALEAAKDHAQALVNSLPKVQLSAPDPRLELIINHVIMTEKGKLKEFIESLLRYDLEEHENKIGDIELRTTTPAKELRRKQHIDLLMRQLGVDMTALGAQTSKLKSSIMGDAKYLMIDESEKTIWRKGENKRNWCLEKALIETKLRFLENLHVSSSASDLLSKLAQIK